MRREIFRMTRDDAVAFLEAAAEVRFASTAPDGTPIFRTVNGVVLDGYLAFHGAPTGEKLEAIGREAVFCSEETVAQIPSYFVDPERACPATTLYRSVQVHGVLEAVDDPDFKARALAALMAKLQPEGGYVPIAADHPLYKSAVKGLLIVRVSLEKLDGKAKLTQNRTPAERAKILEQLWRRGDPPDARAIDLIRAWCPDTPAPPFLEAPAGVTLLCAPPPRLLPAAAKLLAPAYWNGHVAEADLVGSLRDSTAWIAAVDSRDGALIGTTRLLSDGVKWAGIYDVMIADGWRGRGVGQALIRLALDHPRVRRARKIWLRTKDAQKFYERFGFVEGPDTPNGPYAASEMLLRRS